MLSLSKQIRDFPSSKDYDIIAITTPWLSNHIYTNAIFPHSYKVFCKDRDGREGGVILTVKNTIHTEPIPNHLEVISTNIIQCEKCLPLLYCDCQSIFHSIFKAIYITEFQSLHWYCNRCEPLVQEMLKVRDA